MDGKLRYWVTQFEIAAFLFGRTELTVPLRFEVSQNSPWGADIMSSLHMPWLRRSGKNLFLFVTKLTQHPHFPKQRKTTFLGEKHETSLNIPVSNNQTECLFEANENRIRLWNKLHTSVSKTKNLVIFCSPNKKASPSHFKSDIFLETNFICQNTSSEHCIKWLRVLLGAECILMPYHLPT